MKRGRSKLCPAAQKITSRRQIIAAWRLNIDKRQGAQGKRSADLWSQQQAGVWYQQLKRQGVCR